MIVDKILQRAGEKNAERRQPKLGAYNIGRCVRASWYIEHGYAPEPMNPRAHLVFDLGNRIEDALVHWLEEAGIAGVRRATDEDTIELLDTKIRIRPDLFFEDGGEKWLAEIKSMSNFGFEKAVAEGEVDQSYRMQMECYLRGYDIENGLFLLYRKETSHLHEIPVKRDDRVWKQVLKNIEIARRADIPQRPYQLQLACDLCKGSGKTLKRGQDCSRCHGTGKATGGPFIPNFPCGYCDFKNECWGGVAMVTVRGAPKWKAYLGNGKPATEVPPDENVKFPWE